MHGVDLPEQMPDLGYGPLGRHPGRGLVPPHAPLPGQSPQTESEGPRNRDQPDGRAEPSEGYVCGHGEVRDLGCGRRVNGPAEQGPSGLRTHVPKTYATATNVNQ
ncbi:hypothetical protein GCM10017687_35410 [Streptomyces echinatus]